MDALTNYISATNYFSKENNNNVWPANIQIIGKDILRVHAVYWPASLMAAKINLPKKNIWSWMDSFWRRKNVKIKR